MAKITQITSSESDARWMLWTQMKREANVQHKEQHFSNIGEPLLMWESDTDLLASTYLKCAYI
ncbi:MULTISPECIES: hypothetical protein [Paenibacillus]|nr:hypothetical protein [Paenibacillus odorifer]OMD08646.1 hypothetical protein BJP50_30730 [Paenibacillus odorifer]OMD13389.1 hypothetical protein BJP47_24760 [Paenibacillus odorifer]OMD24819.1 hypothetical protein BJP48_24870 [Paenibacillus odorifer]